VRVDQSSKSDESPRRPLRLGRSNQQVLGYCRLARWYRDWRRLGRTYRLARV